jgi:FtsP/CotA-like multicopper oxidase with cupredoxin domain
MPRPVRRRHAMIGPAERLDLIVDFSSAAGQSVELRSGPRSDGKAITGSRPYVGALMQFRVDSGRVRDRTKVPHRLRPLPAWTRHVSRTPDHRWAIEIGGSFTPTWVINGRTFNPARADAFPEIDTTVTWEVANKTAVAHLIHLHHTDWYLLERNGRRPPLWEDCLKDTFFILPSERILIAGHFSDYLGKFVIHCHMLDHEDHGLMSQFEVVKKRPRER